MGRRLAVVAQHPSRCVFHLGMENSFTCLGLGGSATKVGKEPNQKQPRQYLSFASTTLIHVESRILGEWLGVRKRESAILGKWGNSHCAAATALLDISFEKGKINRKKTPMNVSFRAVRYRGKFDSNERQKNGTISGRNPTSVHLSEEDCRRWQWIVWQTRNARNENNHHSIRACVRSVIAADTYREWILIPIPMDESSPPWAIFISFLSVSFSFFAFLPYRVKHIPFELSSDWILQRQGTTTMVMLPSRSSKARGRAHQPSCAPNHSRLLWSEM